MEYSPEEIWFVEQLKILSNPTHPEYEKVRRWGEQAKILQKQIDWPELKKFTVDIKHATKRADQIIRLVKGTNLTTITSLPSLDMLTVICIMSKMDGESSKKAQQILRTQKSEYAKRSRPNNLYHSHKDTVRRHWEDWQKDPSSFASKAAFIRQMTQNTKYDINEMTYRNWIKNWEAVTKIS